ncbi:hypothetical protein H6F67_26285 [Microcoleus sp. FACHB-1515]|uniref:hypothetical protein n=1 Tax=Cyanophyceae TaxID=3028117 RepID=UPI0016857DC9|nr:hypothetical protein [Microcoleus sp. FACHB-1515]MBD2093358.1 hypothetical protein [Microcoleus sp. FACHB-1515]
MASSTYADFIQPWCVIRVHQGQASVIARFRSRNDADGHVHILNRHLPGTYQVQYQPSSLPSCL